MSGYRFALNIPANTSYSIRSNLKRLHLTLLSLSSDMPQTGQEYVDGDAGDSTSLCSILTCNSRSGAELKVFTHNGHENTSPAQLPTDGEVRSKCCLEKDNCDFIRYGWLKFSRTLNMAKYNHLLI